MYAMWGGPINIFSSRSLWSKIPRSQGVRSPDWHSCQSGNQTRSNMTKYHVIYPWQVFSGHLGSCKDIWGHEELFWWYFGLSWCCFGPFWGPRGPLKRAQGGPTWHIIMLYSHLKWFRVIWGHAVPFWAILVILSHSGHFGDILGYLGAVLGHYGAPVGLWKGPRVVQHDI